MHTLQHRLQHRLQHTVTHTATHCNALRLTATHCNSGTALLECTRVDLECGLEITDETGATHCNTTATHCIALQRTATYCTTLKHTAMHCIALQRTATHCNTLQHTATHCNTLQHTATHYTMSTSAPQSLYQICCETRFATQFTTELTTQFTTNQFTTQSIANRADLCKYPGKAREKVWRGLETLRLTGNYEQAPRLERETRALVTLKVCVVVYCSCVAVLW